MSPRSNLFIGREKELAELRAGLAEALSGQGRLFLISGEPGIGKTRLAEELAGEAATGADAVRVLWGRCWEGEGGPAFWPWVQCLRSHVGESEPQALGRELGVGGAIIAQLVPEIRQKLPELPEVSLPADAEQARALLFDAVVSLVRNASRTRPLLLVFDDLHWADQPSLLLMRFLARNLRDARILVLGVYRDVELRSATQVEGMLADLTRETRHVALHGLALLDVKRLIEAAGGQAVDAPVVAQIHAATEGNPFFVAEVVRLLAAEKSPKEWSRSLAGRIPVPSAVRTAIRRHLGSLSSQSRGLLGAASVVGREFDLSLLERALGGSPLLAQLSDGVHAGMVSRVPNSLDRYRFSHALVRETLYDDVDPAERAQIHRRVGEALEKATDASVAELAHHFFEAAILGEADKAIDYSKRAAEQAMQTTAYEEAARHLERALGIVARREPRDDGERCDLLLLLGQALWAFELKRSKEVLLEAAKLAEALGDGERLARAAISLGGQFGTSADAGVIDAEQIVLLERALAILGNADTALGARVIARLANALRMSTMGAAHEAVELARKAVGMARRVGDKAALAQVLASSRVVVWGPDDDPQEFIAASRELVTLATEIRNPSLAMFGRLVTFGRLLEIGDRDAADREAESALELSRMQSDSFARLTALIIPGAKALIDGRFDEAEAGANRMAAVARETQNQIASQISFGYLYLVREAQGRIEELLGDARSIADRYPGLVEFRCRQLAAAAEAGRDGEARSVLETLSAQGFAAIPRDTFWLGSMFWISEAVARLSDAPRAATLYELLRPYATRIATQAFNACYGSVARQLGLLATTLARFEEAETHFELAIQKNVALRSRPYVAQTQNDYAHMLLQRHGPGDVEKARDLAAQALATSRELGMKALEARLLALGEPARLERNMFRQEEKHWKVAYEGRSIRLRNTKGMHYLAFLLRHPNKEFHVMDLASAVAIAADAEEEPKPREQRAQLESLRSELEEATRWDDAARAAAIQSEIDRKAEELASAYGLGRSGGKGAETSERVRKAVTKRIRDAVARIREKDASLGRHLATSITTGAFCSYRPDEPGDWSF